RARHRPRRDRGDRGRQHRLRDRPQGRPLGARAPWTLLPAAPGGAAHRRALLRAPRLQGGVLRPLPARPARVGLVARGHHAPAVAASPPATAQRAPAARTGRPAGGPPTTRSSSYDGGVIDYATYSGNWT